MTSSPSLKLQALCRVAGVSRSGFYYYLKNNENRLKRDLSSLEIIQKFFDKSRKKGGTRTIDMMIRNSGIKPINHKKIQRIKREYGLITKIRRKNPYKSLPTSENAFVPNLLRREFVTPLPNSIYSTDMTFLFYGSGEKAYLSATKDLGTNEIVSYKLMRSPSVSQFTEEFKSLLGTLSPNIRSSLIIHSDQGFQYTHEAFRNLLKEFGVTQSMSRRANCYDNAPIESFFGHFKDLLELKKCKTFEDVKNEVKEVMEYYNNERPQKALNNKAPACYRGFISGHF
ncbi:IS3 family transposase [Peredibacter starrii]|uniref:IS3 family transposase n=1 Tax=Peredibacter starrii TaxID=28202 RepID=A0AAX4HVD9_9BACT|nr:IS3 family transposase [Peredibacter starrii]WPU67226.1 IS3 family transposase [Peredibacter starrii]